MPWLYSQFRRRPTLMSQSKYWLKFFQARYHFLLSANSKETASVYVKHNNMEYLLCSLQQGSLFQQTLDLEFVVGEEVELFTSGKSRFQLPFLHIDICAMLLMCSLLWRLLPLSFSNPVCITNLHNFCVISHNFYNKLWLDGTLYLEVIFRVHPLVNSRILLTISLADHQFLKLAPDFGSDSGNSRISGVQSIIYALFLFCPQWRYIWQDTEQIWMTMTTHQKEIQMISVTCLKLICLIVMMKVLLSNIYQYVYWEPSLRSPTATPICVGVELLCFPSNKHRNLEIETVEIETIPCHMVHVPPLCMVDRWTISILLLEIPRLHYDAE